MSFENSPTKTAEQFENVSPLAKGLLESLGEKSGNKILQIGLGGGEKDYELFASRGNDVTVLYKNLPTLEKIGTEIDKSLKDHIHFIASDIEEAGLKGDQFDAVISLAGLDYTHLPRSLREIKRVLRPGGMFSLLLYEKMDKYKFRDAEKVKQEVSDAGLEVLDFYDFTDPRHKDETKIMVFKLKK